jgi:hypothetical protein
MKNVRILFEPTFQSDGERDYAVAILERRERVIAIIFLVVRVFAWIPVLLLGLSGKITDPAYKVMTAYGVVQAVTALILLLSNVRTKTLVLSTYYMLILAQVFWTISAMIESTGGLLSPSLIRSWVFSVVFGVLFFPMRSWQHHKLSAITIPSLLWACMYSEKPILAAILATIGIVAAQNIQIITHRMVKRDAINAFREKSRYIPRQVLRKAAQADVKITDVFSPSDRYCVCICSDWSHFKSLISDETMMTLGISMTDYYGQIMKILNEQFPEGNFFIDWIADELFVVIFAEDKYRNVHLMNEGFEAARKIFRHHQGFVSKNRISSGIDIGMSDGIAAVGIFGTGGIAKATAFGSAPGLARRMHSVCHKLRREHGSYNRIVMTDEFAHVLASGGIDVSRVSAEISKSTKDVSDEKIYFWPRLSALLPERRSASTTVQQDKPTA